MTSFVLALWICLLLVSRVGAGDATFASSISGVPATLSRLSAVQLDGSIGGAIKLWVECADVETQHYLQGLVLSRSRVYGGSLAHKNREVKTYESKLTGSLGGWAVATVHSEDDTLSLVWRLSSTSPVLQAMHRRYAHPKAQKRALVGASLIDDYVVDVADDEHFEGCSEVESGLAPSELRPEGFQVSPRSDSMVDGGEFFPGCFPGDSRVHSLQIGLVADVGFVSRVGSGSLTKTEEKLENIVAASNQVFRRQFNVQKVISRLIMYNGVNKDSGDLPWPSPAEQGGSTCLPTMNRALEDLANWSNRLGKAHQLPHWHLLTACTYGSSVKGLAYVGTLSKRSYNAAVTYGAGTGSSAAWRVFAHEVGHGMGAHHSFENGAGRTGGLMDYGNGKILGTNQYGFRLAKRQRMCTNLAYAKQETPEQFYVAIDGEPGTCGNGYLDEDEQCECIRSGDTSCSGCHSCRITSRTRKCSAQDFYMATPQITPGGKLSQSECCDHTLGVFQPLTRSCDNGNGYCSRGECLNLCSRDHGYETCGFSNDGCTHSCRKSSIICEPVTSYGKLASVVPDGEICGNHGQGVCRSGICALPTQAPTPMPPTPEPTPPTRSPTKKPTSRPTKQPTPRPTKKPTREPTSRPTKQPTREPTSRPTKQPTNEPTHKPTRNPTPRPTKRPTNYPTIKNGPTRLPTPQPTTPQPTSPQPTGAPTLSKNGTAVDPAARVEDSGSSTASKLITSLLPIAGVGALCGMAFLVIFLHKRRKSQQRENTRTADKSQIALAVFSDQYHHQQPARGYGQQNYLNENLWDHQGTDHYGQQYGQQQQSKSWF